MTPDETLAELAAIVASFDKVTAVDSTDWDTDDAVLVWDVLDRLANVVRVTAYQHAALASRRLPAEYHHPVIGLVHTETEKKDRWDGDGVLNAMSHNMVNPDTGEVVEAVPTAVLRHVIPAALPGHTSSRWNKTGLTAAGIQPGLYCETEWGTKTVKRGPKYRRNLAPSREEPPPAATPDSPDAGAGIGTAAGPGETP